MEVKYHPASDMLNIKLSETKSVESEEVHEGFVFDFDADGRVVSIEVDSASRRVNLAQIRQDADAVMPEAQYDGQVYTAEELSDRIGVTRRALNLIIQNMREAGHSVGLRPDVSVYTEQDERAIRQWRETHPRGRPRSTALG